MTKYLDVDGQSKTINDALENAIEKAMAQLQLPRENVTYELLEKGKAGLFGLGGVTAKVRVYYEVGVTQKAESFLSEVLRLMQIDAKLSMKETAESLEIGLEGPEMGALIGRRGETLDALQYITGLVVNKGEEKHVRVNLDSENYREKRREALEKLARKTAEKAVKYKRSFSLEPMPPQERRIIHTALQNFPGINTHSVGQEPNRRVVVVAQSASRARENKENESVATETPKEGGSKPNRPRRRPRPKNPNPPKTEE